MSMYESYLRTRARTMQGHGRAANQARAGASSPSGMGGAAATAEARARAEAAARARQQRNRNRERESAAGNGPGGPGGGGGQPPGSLLAGDPGVLAARDHGNRDRWLADAQYNYTLGDLGSDYGYAPGGGIDPNNPYSRAALLQESYRRQAQGNVTGYAAQGQLYSGALQNAQSEAGRQFNIGDDRLRKQYTGAVAQAGLDRIGAHNQTYGNETTAFLAALLASLDKGKN